uniref:NADH dehydrogenase [ubiquinone] 1 beta subcomplex subunit 4 n=1 Tax=Ditylenchus dipsaci TaxID=166011 RepID=A0A915EMH0_9BILA
MRLAVRLLRPAPNQNVTNPKMWQDPVRGYFESHGRSEFLPARRNSEEGVSETRVRSSHLQVQARRRRDPAMFRWYAADMTQAEYFRYTPRTVFLWFAAIVVGVYLYLRIGKTPDELKKEKCLEGQSLWWDRQEFRGINTAGHGILAPNWPMGW